MTARYVAPEVIGYEDLDAHGSWQVVGDHGNVWIPRSVPTGWAPYRDGHWSWIDPWGWTWVDDAPWGFAPFHYGRWAYAQDRWFWVPGPARTRPVYAPALVAFVGGPSFSVSVTGGNTVGWFPLGPGEVYRPAYNVSRDYFTRVNVANTVVSTTYVTNIYGSRDMGRVRYAHMQRPAAITAVPEAAFVQSRPVSRSVLRVTPQLLDKAEVMHLAKVAPQRASFTGAAPAARATPPQRALDKPVVAKAPPPSMPPPIASRLPMLNQSPGMPLDRASPQAPASASGSPPRNVRVVNAAEPQPAPRGRGAPQERARAPERDTAQAPAPAAPPAAVNSAPPGSGRGQGPQSTPPQNGRDRPVTQDGRGRTSRADDGPPQGQRGAPPAEAPAQPAPQARTAPVPPPSAAVPPPVDARERPRGDEGRARGRDASRMEAPPQRSPAPAASVEAPRPQPAAPPSQVKPEGRPEPAIVQAPQANPRGRGTSDERAMRGPPQQSQQPQAPPLPRAREAPQIAQPAPAPQRAQEAPSMVQSAPAPQRGQDAPRGRPEARAAPQASPQAPAQGAPPQAAPAPAQQERGDARRNDARENRGGGKREGNDNDRKP